jgi:hypothetical protein
MTAKEMFEGIGYKLSKAYSEDTLISYFDGKKNITIEFYIKNKQFKKAKGVFDCVAIKESELKAIIQQCKELGWLEEEKQETKQETNIEHYFEYLSEVGLGGFAVVNGRCTKCSGTRCSECDFSYCDCCNKRLRWLASPYRKKYKLTKFENDLLQSYLKGCLSKHTFKSVLTLNVMKEKGYFKGVDGNTTIKDILADCEVIKDVNG